MKTTNNIPNSLLEDIQSDITYKKSVANLGKGICYIVVGIAAAVLLMVMEIGTSSWEVWGLGFVGTALIIMGFVAIFGSKPDVYYKGEKVAGYQAFFANPSTAAIGKFIDEKNTETLRKTMNTHDNGLRVNMAMTESGSLCRYRMYKYVPFEYKPEGEIVEIDRENGVAFAGL
ncbi:MAG: hypothetical protein MJZ93_03630 [Paludibacteraceae bacterium]|nr:hypothetical protein [Paludibacteraceae bacterium]